MKAFIAVLCCLATATSAYASYDIDHCFPGNKQIFSPSRRHSLSWDEPKTEKDTHHVYYDGAKRTELLEFYRSVCVSWSPSEEFFALTDYTGSNVSQLLIYMADDVAHPRNIVDFLPSPAREEYAKSSHGYVEATVWDKRGLSVRVWGDTLDTYQQFESPVLCEVDAASIRCVLRK